ncbi:hypothetical protein [Burkholderia sp. BE17]|uniref:hypothetical protein n=1 Tax=Burkholderia sp. BE17 TaxID=2656644 RepID=UPI001D105631|nr:hypothetical protein [Burkholderia sp. BE17]
MKTPVNETLVMDIAGDVAVVVTDVAAVVEALVRLGFARVSCDVGTVRLRGAVRSNTSSNSIDAMLISRQYR